MYIIKYVIWGKEHAHQQFLFSFVYSLCKSIIWPQNRKHSIINFIYLFNLSRIWYELLFSSYIFKMLAFGKNVVKMTWCMETML